MPVAKKIAAKNRQKKKAAATVAVMRSRTSANDSLFPEKVARARKILSNTQDL